MSATDDRMLLTAAAKAAGIEGDQDSDGGYVWINREPLHVVKWNPLTDDGDALRLAVKRRLTVEVSDDGHEVYVGAPTGHHWTEICDDDPCVATRRAITSLVAAIGKESQP